METEIKQVFMSEDRSRRAEIFLKNDVWHVNMIIGGQLVECRPMVSGTIVHSERYAEDAAENWCLGIIT
jgi:hypothetical protein